MPLDLHVHSTASDGTVSPRELVRMAIARDLRGLAIADHDSVGGVADALDAASGVSLAVIPAVELSASHDGRSIHMLGYFVDPDSDDLARELDRMRDARLSRAASMVAALAAAGYPLELADVLRQSDGGSVGRSHVARALVAAGQADTVEDAFRRFVGRGRPFYIPKPAVAPATTIDVIRAAGGIAVLAHPGVSGVDDLVDDLVDAGLEGLEVFHAQHDEPARARYLAMARERGMLVTGGSDYHGPGQGPGVDLGAAGVPEWVLPELLASATP